MSLRPIRIQAAAEAAAAQAAADARHTEARPHHGRHGAGHHGQFGGYVFRPGRAPAAPPQRRPVPLRRRPPQLPGANSAGTDHENEHGPMLNMALLPQSSAVEDQDRAATLDVDAMGRHEDPHGAPQEDASHQRRQALRWRTGLRAWQDADAALLPGLQAACGPGAQALWAQAAPSMAVRAEDLARALVEALVGIDTAAAPAEAGPGATTLQLAAVRSYLMQGPAAGMAGRPLATLERVKRALLESRGQGAQRPAGAMPDEARQNRNLLLPLKLLNADRPRTEAQVRQACSRIELCCQVGAARGRTDAGT